MFPNPKVLINSKTCYKLVHLYVLFKWVLQVGPPVCIVQVSVTSWSACMYCSSVCCKLVHLYVLFKWVLQVDPPVCIVQMSVTSRSTCMYCSNECYNLVHMYVLFKWVLQIGLPVCIVQVSSSWPARRSYKQNFRRIQFWNPIAPGQVRSINFWTCRKLMRL